MHRRRLAVPALAVLLALGGCGGEEDRGPYRYDAQRIVALPDGTLAVAGMATAGPRETSGCRVGGSTVRDYFVTRLTARGRVLRTDVVTEEEIGKCGSSVLSASAGADGSVEAMGWWHVEDVHGPVDLSFGGDGSTSHDLGSAAQRLSDFGWFALAGTSLPGGGYARMWSIGDRTPLRLEIERGGRPAVQVPVTAVHEDASLMEVWYGGHSLSADATGVFGSTHYTRRQETPYLFPIFRYRLDATLDRSFGGDGVVFVEPPRVEHFQPTQTLADGRGRVLATGGTDEGDRRVMFVLRYLADGRLDPSFGRGGATWFSLRRPPGNVEDMRNTSASIAVLRDGRIAFAGGIRDTRSTVWMLRPDGTLDRSFGRNGRVVLSP